MRLTGLIFLVFAAVNLHSCSKGDIQPTQLAIPFALILGIGLLACGKKVEEYEKDPSAYDRDMEEQEKKKNNVH